MVSPQADGDVVEPIRTPGRNVPVQTLNIRFTGSGSEYFRIWIVNVLLTIVTLGIYFPWAKVRRLRYFYGNTLVDGSPLDFHGDPRQMLKGYFLVAILFSLYSAAGKFSPTAGLVALLIVAAIWPALFRAAMRFRLANTSWRGLRFQFTGTLRDAYLAAIPAGLAGFVFVATPLFMAPPARPTLWLGLAPLLALLASPYALWKLKQYQHQNYALAGQQTLFKATVSAFYGLWLKTLALPIVIIAVITALGFGLAFAGGGAHRPAASMFWKLIVGGYLVMLMVFIGVHSYWTSRFQNLMWTKTGNSSFRFLSDLPFKRLFWLTLKNWLLTLITVGMYWPFAAVAVARLREESVSIRSRIDPDILMGAPGANEQDASGEAAGDLFGFDIGL